VSESPSIQAALHQALTGDEALMALIHGVYRNTAPPEAVYPFLLYQRMRGVDRYTMGKRVCTTQIYQLKVVDKGYSAVQAEAAMERADLLLTDQPLAVAGRAVWMIRRVGDFEFAEPGEFGVLYQHVGGTWQIVMA
jgi:hypothetical protein